MKKLLAVGVIVLFLGLAIAPSINANIRELSVDNTLVVNDTIQLEWKFPGYCTILYIVYWFFLTLVLTGVISTEIPFLIEDYAIELKCYWAQKNNRLIPTPVEDCGCEEQNMTQWNFPGVCILLYPLWIISVALLMLFSGYQFFWFMEDLGKDLNCFWARPEISKGERE